MAILEVACFDPDDALLACEAGADRIELCDNREAGGTSPPLDWLIRVTIQVSTPVFAMVRPRPGNFIYSNEEFEIMKAQIEASRSYASGFVFGILDERHQIDVGRTATLVQLAHPAPCTFHRAFDDTPDIFEALERVVEAGFSAVLTSGGEASALVGIERIGKLVQLSQGRIAVVPGGGLRSGNIAAVREQTGATVFHSSAVPEGSERPTVGEIRGLKMALE